MKSKTKYTLVYLEWEDAITNNLKWFSEGEAMEWDKNMSMIVKECGFILKEDKRHVFLVNRISDTRYSSEGSMEFGGLHKIPKTWIRKRKVLNP